MQLEMFPASDWCQRWDHSQPSWRHRSDGGFNADDYEVRPIDEATAKSFILEHHYSGTYPSASQRYGLFRNSDCGNSAPVGVCVLGVPVQESVLTGVFPDLEPYVETLELSRFCLVDACPGNSESWFLGQVFHDASGRGMRGIVSFADPVPRTINETVVFPGHIGVIYQATNAVYTGRATPRTITVLPNGSILNDRAKQKVRAQERGHEHVERRLVELGARVPTAGEKPAAWLAEAIVDAGAVRIRHHGNHRYCFRLGATRQERNRVRISLPGQVYPKVRDAA